MFVIEARDVKWQGKQVWKLSRVVDSGGNARGDVSFHDFELCVALQLSRAVITCNFKCVG